MGGADVELVKSFLERVVENDFKLTDNVTRREREAILRFIGAERAISSQAGVAREPGRSSAPIMAPPKLDFGCLSLGDVSAQTVGLDFGTAFSKATVFDEKLEHPIPLELEKSATGRKGLLLESTVYIGNGGTTIFFGPQAMEVSSAEDDVTRMRFDSPKQVLSIEGAEGLSSKVDAAIDPTRTFTKRDLLTLYLGYLSAMVSDQLVASGHQKYATRRYAMPVWSAVQVKEISHHLKQMLLDAQILADSIPVDVWRNGFPVEYARSVLSALKQECPANDARRASATVIGTHVLEASAAAAAIGERLRNRRPVALVVDIGAGTTDIGLFYFVFPSDRSGKPPKISLFANGSIARKIAGNRLDDILRAYIKKRANLEEMDPVYFRLKRDIREIKRRLALGPQKIEGIDDLQITLEEFVASGPVQQYRREMRNAVEGLLREVGVDAVRSPDGNFGILTGGGANFPIFNDFFDQPFDTSNGTISFRAIDAHPEWLSQLDPAFVPFFGQLAVALGASAPNLPDPAAVIGRVPALAPTITGLSPNYR